tara:strand:- start:12185 stop:12427 length:243 start_codon:yes stop_codon:yes gene_type:complete
MIKKIIKKEILKILPNFKFNKKYRLVSDGYLDSFNILILISSLEKTFNIKINLKNFDIKNLEDLIKIEKLIKKLKKNNDR